LPAQVVLAELAHLEVTQRRERRINRRIQEAHFPLLKTLDSFDFAAQPGIDREQILELAHGQFIEEKRNIVLVGECGLGKSHLAIALGIACCHREYRVRFFTAAELMQTLIEAKAENRLNRLLERLARYDLVLIDELGYVGVDKLGAELLFNFITRVYEKRSLIVTTNLPFARWSEVFHDPAAALAVIDRIVHHSIILKPEGESYRLQAAKHRRHSPEQGQ
jgi:DNA replication protein DnaC